MTPRLAVLAVVVEDDRVLLVQRRNPPDAGFWGYPGGKVEWGETVETAALRELSEETGVTGDRPEVIGHADAITRDASGAVVFHYHLVAVRCRYAGGIPVAADDAMAAEWVPVADVLARRRQMSRDVDKVLRRAL